MIQIGTLGEAHTRSFPEHQYFRGTIHYLFEGNKEGPPAPQAYLVHQQPGWVFKTHYHLEEQFQVFVGGDGRIGSHELAPTMVHYASREAGYGPLVAGDDGLSYFTLRAITDTGLWPLPESRDQMVTGLRKRQETVGPLAALEPDAQAHVIIEPDASGLAAWTLHAEPGASVRAPASSCADGGRFYVVVQGALVHEQRALPRHACIFATPDEPALAFQAGDEGVELLVLQFPASALAARPVKQA